MFLERLFKGQLDLNITATHELKGQGSIPGLANMSVLEHKTPNP